MSGPGVRLIAKYLRNIEYRIHSYQEREDHTAVMYIRCERNF
jgi:hypothetical protein